MSLRMNLVGLLCGRNANVMRLRPVRVWPREARRGHWPPAEGLRGISRAEPLGWLDSADATRDRSLAIGVGGPSPRNRSTRHTKAGLMNRSVRLTSGGPRPERAQRLRRPSGSSSRTTTRSFHSRTKSRRRPARFATSRLLRSSRAERIKDTFSVKWTPNNYTTITRKRTISFKAGESITVDLTIDASNDRAQIRHVPTPDFVVDAMIGLARIRSDDVCMNRDAGMRASPSRRSGRREARRGHRPGR